MRQVHINFEYDCELVLYFVGYPLEDDVLLIPLIPSVEVEDLLGGVAVLGPQAFVGGVEAQDVETRSE